VEKPVDFEELNGSDSEGRNRRRKPPTTQHGGGGAVYGLGLIGALVWFWWQANEPGDYVVALLKALVWPAFLVYKAFEALQGLTGAERAGAGQRTRSA
jgi:hypothetical protein